jgi:GNAT superfamily N-acetyltransferase
MREREHGAKMSDPNSEFRYRLLERADLEGVPLSCQGTREQIAGRIAEIGSSAMLAFEGSRHVGQLQFRPYVSGTRSPDGINDPLYWMDFEGREPALPEKTLALFCFHVGQLEAGQARDPRYFGRGMGTGLLDATLAWARRAGFQAVVAKATPPTWPIPQFMGGMPLRVYASRGFEEAASYRDAALRSGFDGVLEGRYGSQWQEGLRALVREGADLDDLATASICVLKNEPA